MQKEIELLKRRKEINSIQSTRTDTYDTMEVALIGDEYVGKTSLIRRYVNNEFKDDVKATIGIAPSEFNEILANNSIIKITIWDTAGQERYLSIASGYYKRADVMLVCYDMNQKVTLDHCNKWRQRIEAYAKDNVFVILVACKADLLNIEYKSQAQDILQQNEWKKFDAVYCECSAKTGDNVRNVFLTAAETIATKRRENGLFKKMSSVLDNVNDAHSSKKCPYCVGI
eukprot:UN13033